MGYLWLLLVWLFYGLWAVGEAKFSAYPLPLAYYWIIATVLEIPAIIFFAWYARRDLVQPINWGAVSWIGVAVYGSIFGSLAYIQALRTNGIVSATIVSALYPVASVLMLWALGTVPTARQWAGIVLAMAASILLARE